MAHFAQIDDNNKVLTVRFVPNEHEHRGQDFLANDLNLGGTWVQTSFNHRIRRRFAGPGMTYDPVADVFITPQPKPWYVLNDNHDWVCPIGVKPETGEEVTPEEWEWIDSVFTKLQEQ